MSSSTKNTPNNNNNNNNNWIYHERQYGQLCGQHALNNFVQGPIYTIIQLAEIAHQLDVLESTMITTTTTTTTSGSNTNTTTGGSSSSSSSSSHHVDEAGNFSIEVLKAALLQTYDIHLLHVSSQSVQTYLHTNDITTIHGFICHKNDHWFCIRQLYGRYWNLNSTLPKPVVISHFTFATEMELYATQYGYTIFCIVPPQTLPQPSLQSTFNERGIDGGGGGKWYTMTELLYPTTSTISLKDDTSLSTITTKVDPWEKLNGTGRRLDGQQQQQQQQQRSTTTTTTTIIDGLTEEEMIQIALQQSMEPTINTTTTMITTTTSSNASCVPDTTTSTLMLGPMVVVPTEPNENDTECIKIQFRFPSSSSLYSSTTNTNTQQQQSRIVRRFYKTNTIADIYYYVQSVINNNTTNIANTTTTTQHFECIVGYPPKNMLYMYPNAITTTTIEESNMANATIQIRFVSN